MEAIIVTGLTENEKHIIKNTPKPLIKINGKTIIEHQAEVLKKCGVQRLTLVTGALGSKIQAVLSDFEKDEMVIRFMGNPQFDSTGNAFSFLYGLLGIDDDVIYMDEGVLYEPQAIRDLLAFGKRITIGVKKETFKDSLYVYASNQVVAEMGLDPQKNEAVGAYAGIARIPQRCLLDLRCKLHTLFKSPYRLMATFEEAIQLAVSSRTKVEWMSISEYTGGMIRSQKDIKKISPAWESLKEKSPAPNTATL